MSLCLCGDFLDKAKYSNKRAKYSIDILLGMPYNFIDFEGEDEMRMEDFPKEGRRFPRVPKILPVQAKIIDRKGKEISTLISLETKDVSQGGMQLDWPKGWSCKECVRCPSWTYNRDCQLRRGDKEAVRPIPSNIYLKIDMELIAEIISHIVWVGSPDNGNGHYPVGVFFTKKSLKTPALN